MESEGLGRVHALEGGGIGRGSGVVVGVREKGAAAVVGPLRGTATDVGRHTKSIEKKSNKQVIRACFSLPHSLPIFLLLSLY